MSRAMARIPIGEGNCKDSERPSNASGHKQGTTITVGVWAQTGKRDRE